MALIEKSILFFFLFSFTSTCISQSSAFYELRHFAISMHENKNIENILSIESEVYTIDLVSQNKSVDFKQLEYYDGEGNLAFSYLNDVQNNDIRHWIKQSDGPHQFFRMYTNWIKDSDFSIKPINESTHLLEFSQEELNFNITISIDSNMIRAHHESTIIECRFDEQYNFNEIKYSDKNGETIFVLKIEILTSDEKNNWTSRIIKNISGRDTSTHVQKRTIKYADQYNTSKFFDLNIDSLLIDNQLIVDPEILSPQNFKSNFNSADEETKLKQKRIYESILKLFYKKYFNSNYFLNFSIDEKKEIEVLRNRLSKQLPAYVLDIKNKRHYNGRTNSKRWFDKTESFDRLQHMEIQPSPTDSWAHINGYLCREYIRQSSTGEKEIFYVSEELPFINYGDFTFTLPGFVIKSTRDIHDLGEVTIVTSITPSDYPFHFLEFMNGLNDTYGVEFKYLQKIEQ